MQAMPSLRADSTDSLKRREVPPPVESANQATQSESADISTGIF